MSKKKRIYLLFFILLLLLIISLLLGNKFLVTENKTFEKFCSNLLKEELKQDTLSLHYTLKNPENYGIEQTQVSLPLYSEKDYAQLPILLENYIATLDHIDPEKLNDKNASCYTLLYDYIRSKQEGIGF